MVIQKLKEGSTEYRLSNNGTTVSVPEDKVAELRLELAAAGVPKSGRIGFEIFDKTNFGMTDFAEHINYRRAVEGELERSVMAIAEVEQARVHITFPKESVFSEAQQPAKASVLIKIRAGDEFARDRDPRDHAFDFERRRGAGSGVRLRTGYARQLTESRQARRWQRRATIHRTPHWNIGTKWSRT